MSTQVIASGSSISDTSVSSGDTLSIASGGTMVSMTIDSGGSAVVSYGATDADTTILSGGYETLSGSATGDAVYGTQLISFGSAVATSETVYSGGAIDLFLKGGVVGSTTVTSGGTLAISGNATASNTTLSAGALLDLESPKTQLEGSVILAGPATIDYAVVPDAGYGDLAVISGFGSGSIIDEQGIGTGVTTLSTVVSGGETIATITNATTSASATLLFAGSVTSLGLLADGTGGVELVYGSGTSSVTLSGTSTTSTTSGGTIIVSGGSTSSGALITSGSTLLVESGGTAIQALIGSGGTAIISGTDSASVINAGGFETVSGQAIGDDVHGTQLVSATNATVTSETIFSGGTVELFLKTVAGDAITVIGGGTLAINGNIQALDTVLDSGGLIDMQSPKAALTGDLTFNGAATLEFDAVASAGYGDLATIEGFASGAVIDERSIGSGATLGTVVSGGSTIATITSGSVSETLTFSGSIASHLALAADGMNGVEVTYVPCFAQGTRVMTDQGYVAVEALSVGDQVMTLEGATLPVIWIGHRIVDCAGHPDPAAVMPVRIQAHAFGRNQPGRDLLLSPDHAVFAEAVLIPVKHLINGDTIRQLSVSAVTYYHVELPQHAVLDAEGLPAESYLDSGDRGAFAMGHAATTLHPVWGGEARDRQLLWEACGAAPLCITGPVVDRVRAKIAAQAKVTGQRLAG